MKLLFRYFVAVIMIPVGVALGVLGVIQNTLRRNRYGELHRQMTAEINAAGQNSTKGPEQSE